MPGSSRAPLLPAQWLFTSPDIYQHGGEIVLRSTGHPKRAIYRETRGGNWVLEGSLKWQAGEHGQAGVFFCYGDTSSYYFLSFGPKLEIIRSDTEVLKETDFAYERGRWYRYRIQRRELSFTVSIDGREHMRFRDDRTPGTTSRCGTAASRWAAGIRRPARTRYISRVSLCAAIPIPAGS